MTDMKASNVIQSLQVGCAVLDIVASSGRALKYNDIYEMAGMSKSNLHKYLNTLTMAGLLYRDKSSGLYSLGSKLVEYGMKAVNQENVVERVMPFLHEINSACKNTVLLTMWSQNGPMVIRLINSLEGLNIGAQIGTVLPITSAAGKVFAAFSGEPVTGDWQRKEWERLDEAQRQTLAEDLEAVREHAIAFASGPLVSSISSIAVPIFNFEARLLGVIVVVGFSETIASRMDEMMSQYLIKMRNEVSEAFGYHFRSSGK